MCSMRLILIVLLSVVCSNFLKSQEPNSAKLVGSPCEGCEAVFEYGNKNLSPIDTLPGFYNAKQKLKITGIIYQPDGKTPAENVILYIYHTNEEGLYKDYGNETGLGKRHGSNRGWIKTGKDGRYTFYTLKAASYPNSTIAAHIHPVILEPSGKYYYLEDFYFEGDDLLKEKHSNPSSPRGGSKGLLTLNYEDDILITARDLILGKNIPGY